MAYSNPQIEPSEITDLLLNMAQTCLQVGRNLEALQICE